MTSNDKEKPNILTLNPKKAFVEHTNIKTQSLIEMEKQASQRKKIGAHYCSLLFMICPILIIVSLTIKFLIWLYFSEWYLLQIFELIKNFIIHLIDSIFIRAEKIKGNKEGLALALGVFLLITTPLIKSLITAYLRIRDGIRDLMKSI